MTISIRPIHPVFVGEVSGIDISQPLSRDEVAAIDAGMDRYAVLVFHDQKLTDEQQMAFSCNFGPLEDARGGNITKPEDKRLQVGMNDVSNLGKDGRPLERDSRQRAFNLGNMLWHSDSSFRPIPAKYSLLSARVVNPVGGNTEFADMRAAYDALDAATRTEIEDLICEHSLMYSRGSLGMLEYSDEERAMFEPVRQRLVRTHPVTGRKSLYLSSHAGAVVGLPMADARILLRDLNEHATQPAFVHVHRWRPGDFVMWDNRQVMHRVRRYDDTQPRDMRRTTVAGDAPTYMGGPELAPPYPPSGSERAGVAVALLDLGDRVTSSRKEAGMRHPRVETRILLAALILLAVAATALPWAAPARAAAKGKLVLAWHAGFASRWLDPQEHDGTATPDNFLTALHDALIKNQGTELYDHPALAEKFEFAADAKSATFTLRKGIRFHNGEPVTPQDVKFSYENYRGAKADVFKTKTARVDIVDDRTVRFVFKEPFLDFLTLFGTANVAAPGWVVPEKYYKQVGADGFKQKPIGAGPYKLVHHEPGVKIELEAFEGYYRPVHVKSLVMIAVPEAATRVAMLERGEADIVYFVPGELIGKVGKLPGVTVAPVLSGSFFLEFPGFQDPKNPFHDKRVREAVSLAIDRRAMNQAETAGMGKPTGNWINPDVQYAIEWPEFPRNVEKARQLLKEAGYPNGFDVAWVTPLPSFYSRGERVIAQLREIGIRGRLQTMERGIFLQRLQGGLKDWPGVQIILHGARIGGSWSFWYEGHFKCGGFNARDRLCVKDLDAKFERYEHSINPGERKKLAEEIQRGILENYYLVPVFRHAFVNGIGPRVVLQKWQDVFPTITTGYAYPWEDLKVKEQ